MGRLLLTDPYLWAKALHVVAALLFVSGVLLAAVVLSDAPAAVNGVVQPIFGRVRRWEQRVTTPAMVATWTLGLFLGLTGGWLTSAWLIAKLAFVLALSALHGLLSARLRRVSSGRPVAASDGAAPIVIGLAACIAFLAVAKI